MKICQLKFLKGVWDVILRFLIKIILIYEMRFSGKVLNTVVKYYLFGQNQERYKLVITLKEAYAKKLGFNIFSRNNCYVHS